MQPIYISIPHDLFAPAAYAHHEGTLDLEVLKAGPDLYSFTEPLTWSIDVTNTGDAFLISGTVLGSASTSCARCLEDVVVPITGEVEGYFLIEGSEEDRPEDMEEDEFDILPSDHRIDIAPLLNAAILLEFPLVPLCDNDCKGLCSHCGQNLNEGSCACVQDEDAVDPTNPFAVLRDLDLMLKEEAKEDTLES